jgi:hypothetical protein
MLQSTKHGSLIKSKNYFFLLILASLLTFFSAEAKKPVCNFHAGDGIYSKKINNNNPFEANTPFVSILISRDNSITIKNKFSGDIFPVSRLENSEKFFFVKNFYFSKVESVFPLYKIKMVFLI